MNEPQLKRPYGSFVNKCTYNINHESCKVLSPELELCGKRNAVCSASGIFDTLCFVENKNCKRCFLREGMKGRKGSRRFQFISYFESENISLLKCTVLTPSNF